MRMEKSVRGPSPLVGSSIVSGKSAWAVCFTIDPAAFMALNLYLWQYRTLSKLNVEPFPPFDWSAVERGVVPLQRERLTAVFQSYFPRLIDAGHCAKWEDESGRFEIYFNQDPKRQVISIRISASASLAGTTAFRRFFNAAADLECRIYDVGKATVYLPSAHTDGWKARAARLVKKKWIKVKVDSKYGLVGRNGIDHTPVKAFG